MGWITKDGPLTRTDISFYLPTQIKWGLGNVEKLGLELQIEPDLFDRDRVVLVTDKGVTAAGLVPKVVAGLTGSPYDIRATFDTVPSDSDQATVKQLSQIIRQQKANLIIALGGGSVMDTAKVSSLIATHGGEVSDYEGGFMVPGPCIPVVAIPTTTGTGSEVSLGAVIKDRRANLKMTVFSPFLYPRMAVIDPAMVRTLPPNLVAWTAMDALTHAVESYVSSEREPISQALAFRAVEMICYNLEPAVKEANNLDARAKLQLAATMAGMAFNSAGLGAAHAINHTIGGMFGIHHGLGNAVVLPVVMEFNVPACPGPFASLARAMGMNHLDLADEEMGRTAIAQVRRLQHNLGIPSRYSELDVPADDATIKTIAGGAMKDISLAFNPRKMDLEDMVGLVARAVRGQGG